MTEIVVDASVAVKWLVDEEHTPEALDLLAPGIALHAPAHWLAEAANMLWAKCVIRRQIDAAELRKRIAALVSAPVTVTPLPDLIAEAVETSQALRATVYDTLYLVLAMRRRAMLVTADRRLVAGAQAAGVPYRNWIRWIGDVAET